MEKIKTKDIFFGKRYTIRKEKISELDDVFRAYYYEKGKDDYGIPCEYLVNVEDNTKYDFSYPSYYYDSEFTHTYVDIEEAINIKRAFSTVEFPEEMIRSEVLEYEKFYNIMLAEIKNYLKSNNYVRIRK